jgi:short-subunit dehydrogenase
MQHTAREFQEDGLVGTKSARDRITPMAEPRTALVTGASRGIGLAIAEHLGERGYRLALTARDESRLAAAAESLRAAGAEVMAVAADLREASAPDAIIGAVAERFGPIDVLVNNAGTAPSGKLERTADETLDEVLDLHVKAPFRLLRAVVPGMVQRARGCAIQLASTAGLKGYPLVAAYTAAKHGMVGLTRAVAAELAATAVRVYAVCPGFVDTDITRRAAAQVARLGRRTEEEVLATYAAMNACGRLLQPAEVGALVGELADPACAVASGGIYAMDDMPPTLLE